MMYDPAPLLFLITQQLNITAGYPSLRPQDDCAISNSFTMPKAKRIYNTPIPRPRAPTHSSYFDVVGVFTLVCDVVPKHYIFCLIGFWTHAKLSFLYGRV